MSSISTWKQRGSPLNRSDQDIDNAEGNGVVVSPLTVDRLC
jgi:hypothetical protein